MLQPAVLTQNSGSALQQSAKPEETPSLDIFKTHLDKPWANQLFVKWAWLKAASHSNHTHPTIFYITLYSIFNDKPTVTISTGKKDAEISHLTMWSHPETSLLEMLSVGCTGRQALHMEQ